MASAGVAAGRQAEEALPAPTQPPLAETKSLPLPQPPAPAEEDESYSFLPLVHNIIKCMDKDDPDILQNLNALKTKFQELREIIGTMPGIHLSPEEQQQQLQSLREQVRIKNELLQKYKSRCMFEIPKK